MAGRVAEIRRETGVLPRDFPRRGPTVCIGAAGKRKIPGVDALAGEIYRLPGGFLLPDVQPLPSPAGSSANGGGQAYG